MGTEQAVAGNGEGKIPTGTLKQLNLDDVKVGERFRKDYGDLDGLAGSIKEKGLLQPITVDKSYNLLAGGRRVQACKLAGLTKIPVLIRPVTGEIDAREIELFENIWRQDFEWHERAALVAEIDRLYKSQNLDWSGRKTAELLNRGVTSVARDLELAKMVVVMPELAEKETAAEALKVVEKLKADAYTDELHKRQQANVISIQKGETNVGFHQRALADTLKVADANYRIGDVFQGLAELRTNGMIHVIECDPPYGIDLQAKKAGAKDNLEAGVLGSYQDIPADEYKEFLSKLTKELYRVAAPNSWLVFWFGPTWQHEVLSALKEAKWQPDEIPCIWVKEQGQTLAPEVYLGRGYEPFYMCRKGQPMLNRRGRLNVFDYGKVSPGKKYHSTQRPIPLIEDLLGTLGTSLHVVLVPFLGSGATLRAAYNRGMKGFGWDISADYKKKFMLAVEEDTKKLFAEPDIQDSEAEDMSLPPEDLENPDE